MSQTLFSVCKSFSYSNQFRNYFSLTETSTLTIEILSPFALLCAILNIVFFWKIPNSRQPPFDVLLFLSIFSIVNITIYISTIIYNAVYPIDLIPPITTPDNFNDFCLATGTLRFASQIGVLIYNVIFCLYYTFKIKNPLKAWVQQHNEVHFLCLLLTVISTIVVYLTNDIGVSTLGVCGLKVSKVSLFLQLAIDVFYFVILVLTSFIFLKYLKKVQKFDSKANIFFKYYLIYTFIIAINYLLQSIGIIIMTIDCYTGLTQHSRQSLSLMINILVLILPITITSIIWFHPEARKSFYSMIYKTFKRNKGKSQRDSFYEDMLTTSSNTDRKNSQFPDQIQLQDLNRLGGVISNLKQRNKTSLLATILGCITLEARELKEYGKLLNRTSMGSTQEEHIFGWNMRDRYEIQINQKLILSEKQCFLQNIPAVYLKFISYTASTFQYFMSQDGITFLDESTNPHNNFANIKKNAQNDGGRSGQFFYFTEDNQIILKTVSKKQMTVLLERLENYYTHFKINNQSLIVKLYGLYTAINPLTQQELHFMLMGNICGQIPKKYVSRVYDLKGSTHKRQVFRKQELIKMKKQNSTLLSQRTMKDVDFDFLEQKVWLPTDVSNMVKQILVNDSKFFRDNGLIDYSLIVIKVDYLSYCNSQDYSSYAFSQRKMFKNSKQKEFIYILGLIDYLETWNVKKKSQRWYKSLWNKTESISSQSPHYYAERFADNLIYKIFP